MDRRDVLEHAEVPGLDSEPIQISVERNVLTVKLVDLRGGVKAKGEIVMNEQLPRSGRGHYSHDVVDGLRGFGFWDVQTLKESKEILVHTTFAANTLPGTAEVRGYTWSQIESE